MATVNLGSIKFKWKGTYNGATAYTVDDVVSYNGSSYICILASTGNLPTNATYFEQMSSAGTNGTNGTDLGTTLTTQGDLVYRDGSGLQRLGAGTAGQVLQTGGAGANPSWGTVSSDFVKILETDYSANNVTLVDIDNVFSSTYKHYKLVIHNWTPDQADGSGSYGKLQFKFKNASGVLSSNYYHVAFGTESLVGSNNHSQSTDFNSSFINMPQFGGNPTNAGTSKGGHSCILDILSPYDNTIPTTGSGTSMARNHDDTRFVVQNHFFQHYINGGNETIVGFRLENNGGNIKSFRTVVYGIKN
jgi:hypothetical protein